MCWSLLIANDFPPVASGIATFFYQIWQLLPPQRTRIWAPELPGSEQVDAGYPIPVRRIRLSVGESAGAKAVKTLLTALYAVTQAIGEPPKRLHCGQILSSGLAGWLCRRAFGIPYVIYVYGSETVRLARGYHSTRLMRRILSDSEWVVTNSDATSNEYRRFGVPDGKLLRIYPGVDPRVFRPMPGDPAWIERLDLGNRRVLLTVARLDQRKGHDMVLRSLRRLESDVVYLIAGRGREEDRLRALADELGVQDRVRFLGFVPDSDLPTVYNLCDVFVMPNRVTEGTDLQGDIEGFGISFLEAGACEKPVVAGRSGGAVEAVLDGNTGLLVDPQSEKKIADALQRLLEAPQFSESLGRQARQRIGREFDWRILAAQVEEIL